MARAIRWRDGLDLFWVLPFLAAVTFFLWPNLFEARDAKEAAYAMHIAGGTAVLFTGPFQFVAPLRNRYRRLHRAMGYLFIAGTALAIIGFAMILPLPFDVFLLSQMTALTLWGMATVAALIAIRDRRVLTHQHNMARAFVIAAYFVLARLIDRYLMTWLEPFSSNEMVRLAHSDWLAWVVPLVLVEIWFGLKWNRLLRAGRRSI